MSPDDGGVGQQTAVRVSVDPSISIGESIIEVAKDTSSSIPIIETGSTGITADQPLVLCTHKGRTAFITNCTPDIVGDLVTSLEEGNLPTDRAESVVEHTPNRQTLPIPETGPLAVGHRAILSPCGWVNPIASADHNFIAGEANLDEIETLGLLGRGRGDAATDDPIAEQWKTASNASSDPVVVINANEADNRSLADETLLTGTPLTVLDAAVAVADHISASDVVVYCNETDDYIRKRLDEAIDAACEHFPVIPEVATGPDTFRAGEETMALEAMEGADRIEARISPPGPAEHGLFGRPTVVHTPRTFGQVYRALTRPREFDGDDNDPGTRLVTVTGDVESPVTVELPTDGTLSTATDAVTFNGQLKAAIVGGQFGGLARELTISPSAPALQQAGLGTNGVVELLGEGTCVVAEVGTRVHFAKEENCGRCVPCREGTTQLVELLRAIYDGSYDAEKLCELAQVMHRSSTCDFGVAAARPVTTALDEFESEFRAHSNGRCPSGTCEL